MPLISLIMGLILVGMLLWLVNTYIPMDPAIKHIISIVAIIAVIFWILNSLGNARVEHVLQRY